MQTHTGRAEDVLLLISMCFLMSQVFWYIWRLWMKQWTFEHLCKKLSSKSRTCSFLIVVENVVLQREKKNQLMITHNFLSSLKAKKKKSLTFSARKKDSHTRLLAYVLSFCWSLCSSMAFVPKFGVWWCLFACLKMICSVKWWSHDGWF